MSWEVCWQRTLEVIEKLSTAGFAVNVAKTKFLQDDIFLLGHHIVDGASMPNPAKVEKIGEFSAPTSHKAVQKLFGLLNYFRDYVPGFKELT